MPDFNSILTRLKRRFHPEPKRSFRGWIEHRPGSDFIQGWAAEPGNNAPLDIAVQIGRATVDVTASEFRADLVTGGINLGYHGFRVKLPESALRSGRQVVILTEKTTNHKIVQRAFDFQTKRAYDDFDSFLASSMTQPVVSRPFNDADKSCFAMMENVANQLCRTAAALPEKPLVSVIMPVFNRAGLVAKAIQSVLEQTYHHFELIVVDDGSTDDTADIVERIPDTRLRLIRSEKNEGQSCARNRAMAQAKGEIVAYLDSDNHWDPRYIAAIVGAFHELPDAAAIYSGSFLYHDGSETPGSIRYAHFNLSLLENKNFIDMNAFAHRAGLELGDHVFDPDLRCLEDYDLALRIACKYRMYSVPVLLCHYHFDAAVETVSKQTKLGETSKTVRLEHDARIAQTLACLPQAKPARPVTAIIPNWQALPELRECLESLEAQGWDNQLQIIVVDNNSDAEVRDFLRAQHQSGRIALIQNSYNYGFSHAVNQGIAASAPGSDILLLNNDAILQTAALSYLQDAAYSLPDAGLTVPRQILPAGTKTITTHVPYGQSIWPCDVNLSAHHRNIARLPLFHDGGPVEITFAAFFAVYIRRDVIDQIGVLDAEHGRHYRSDKIYCDLVRHSANRKIYYVPDARAIHRLQVATGTLNKAPERKEEFDRIFRKNIWEPEVAEQFGYQAKAWDQF